MHVDITSPSQGLLGKLYKCSWLFLCLILKAILARVYGRVQRVGYRRFILDTAQELGLSGYVKNERDGSVTIFTQGDEAVLERFIEMVKSPPQPAYVKSIDTRDVKPRPAIKYFTIKPSPLHEELQEGFGAMQSIFMEYWREFRDFRSEFRDYRQEFRDFREEFRDYRSEFRDFRQEFRDYREEFRSFVNEFRDYRQEFREFVKRTDENFKIIMEKYGEISEKLTTILETLVKESRETREMLNETMKLLKEALEKLSKIAE
jgi:acylphosphatase